MGGFGFGLRVAATCVTNDAFSSVSFLYYIHIAAILFFKCLDVKDARVLCNEQRLLELNCQDLKQLRSTNRNTFLSYSRSTNIYFLEHKSMIQKVSGLQRPILHKISAFRKAKYLHDTIMEKLRKEITIINLSMKVIGHIYRINPKKVIKKVIDSFKTFSNLLSQLSNTLIIIRKWINFSNCQSYAYLFFSPYPCRPFFRWIPHSSNCSLTWPTKYAEVMCMSTTIKNKYTFFRNSYK